MGIGTGIGASISSRAIIGRFYQTLEAAATPSWLGQIAMRIASNQESETYKWLGMTPAMREWIGNRQSKGLRVDGLTVANKTFEATLGVSIDDLRRDKTGQLMVRVDELAARAAQHPAKLLSAYIDAGDGSTLGTCYDGQYFFDTDHVTGSSGTLSNSLTYDISDNGTGGTATAPSAATMQRAILGAVQQFFTFKDDQGEPANEGASSFVVMVPPTFMASTAEALSLQTINNTGNVLQSAALGFALRPVVNPWLTWTTKFAVFRTDGRTKPFIDQVEQDVRMDAIAEGSELEFTSREHRYGVTSIRNMAYGYWQHAVLTTIQA